ncbi:MAG: hypothetical protein DME26_20165 [Verrucomicrobia bacterium]|nr:MAG: hypothetical protein DME26_20165 [Verrucomicrobiota bacterium]
MDRSLVLDERTKTVAWRITEYPEATYRFAKTIVLDQRIESMTTFKQIIGRGTRIREESVSERGLGIDNLNSSL